MTNYTSFPKHRDYGIVIKYSDSQYSWCDNTAANRKYLLESNYCDRAIEFYVWENDSTYTNKEDFYKYLKSYSGYGACPLCGKALKLRKRKDMYDARFLGCSGYPECHFTKKA